MDLDQQRAVYMPVFRTREEELLRVSNGARRSRRMLALKASLALLGVAAVAVAWRTGRHWPLSARLRGSTEMESVVKDSSSSASGRSFCAKTEEDIEFHTRSTLAVLDNIKSQEMCCAECNGDPDCGAWTWGKHQGIEGLSEECMLKRLEDGEAPVRFKRAGVVSGYPGHELRKHGVVADLIMPHSGPHHSNHVGHKTCAGYMNVTGQGNFSVVSAQWLDPGHLGGSVAVPRSGMSIEPGLGSRAFLATNCTEGASHKRGLYAAIKLLGKKFRYTTDLSNTGCGCAASVSLVPMQQNTERSKCQDYFCNARGAQCGSVCAEIAVQDANRYAWSTSLHAKLDTKGSAVGYGGGDKEIGRRDWTDAQYGPGAECIDTTWPFQVELGFPVGGDGLLEAINITLSQMGRSCPLHLRLDKYSFKGHDGLAELSNVLAKGVTPVITYMGSKELQWLDGIGGDGQGPCVREAPEACPASVRFTGFTVADIADGQLAPSEAHGPLQAAMGVIHKRLRDRAQTARQAALDNATALRAGSIGGECADDCSPAGVDFQDFGSSTGSHKHVTNGSRFVESRANLREWEVRSLLHIRSAPDEKAKILAEHREGDVLVGSEENGWLNLAHQPGFAQISRKDKVLLKERKVTYEKIVSGTCNDAGFEPIDSPLICGTAAFALGYFDTSLTIYHGPMKRPQGCYLFSGQLFVATHKNNRGNGVVGGREAICASVAYPTTTLTTTTTTSSTTTQTVTTTTSTTTTWGYPSLFCFEVMMTTTYEFGLVKEQIRRQAGIFNCDEYAVFSQNERTYLGKPPYGPKIYTIWFQKAPVWKSQDNTAANTLLFMHLWEALKNEGRWKRHDWTIKADPDAVVLPWRIRAHLKQATGPNNYLVNCNKVPGNPNFPMIFGAFEAFSKQSLQTYFNGGDQRCKNELQWKMWGEDFYMHHCMMHLGVQQYDDFGILSDKRCTGSNCGDGQAGAYHDYKSQASWFACWEQAVPQH